MNTTTAIPYCILLVEDDDFLRAAQAEYLTEVGFRVLQAATGDAARDRLTSDPSIDLLMSDVDLRGPLSGDDLARLIADRHPEFPVVLTSGRGRRYPLRGKFHRFVLKPFSLEDLSSLILELKSQVLPTSRR